MRPSFIRLLLPVTLAVTAACDRSGGDGTSANEDDKIDCRIGRATTFEHICAVEQATSESGRILVIRKPDGGFRRLLVTADGRGVVAADGAEPAVVAMAGDGRIDVAIGGDNFRLPATVRR